MITFTSQKVPYYDFGFLPGFFDESDSRPAKEQLHENFQHGGGFMSMPGFSLERADIPYEEGDALLIYDKGSEDEEPPLEELGRAKLRDETLIFFNYSWLAIVQPDGSFEVTRVD
jgi:hypothetical protein